MADLRFTFLAVSLATVLMGTSLGVAGDSTTAIVNRTALDAGVIMVISNTDGKGDCDCSESLYGGQGQTSSSTSGVEAVPVTIIPAAASPVPGGSARSKALQRLTEVNSRNIFAPRR